MGAQVFAHGKRETYRGEYGGLNADEKALKEAHDYKGAAGIVPCMDCDNLMNAVNDRVIPRGAVGIHTTTLARCISKTNDNVWELADSLKDKKCCMQECERR